MGTNSDGWTTRFRNMGAARTPGPICSTRVGDTWFDYGSMCRPPSGKPSPTRPQFGVSEWGLGSGNFWLHNWDRFKAQFDRDHVYSTAPEAAKKRDIDMQLIGDDYSRSAEISLSNQFYMKDLIRLGSGGRQTVSDRAGGLQFFNIRGGGEGFLPAKMATKNAGDFEYEGTTSTSGKKSKGARFDFNDLLAVFDQGGILIEAALLERPISLPDVPGGWSEATSTRIYNSWDNKGVSIYRNSNFDVEYLGLVVDDGMKKLGWVDIHKQEETNGCIFIVDPDTPPVGSKKLDSFEPKLIVEVLAAVGKTPDQVKKEAIGLGTMHVVTIR